MCIRDRLLIAILLVLSTSEFLAAQSTYILGGTEYYIGEQYKTTGQPKVKRSTANRNAVSYTHLRAHETVLDLVCRLLLEQKQNRRLLCIYTIK